MVHTRKWYFLVTAPLSILAASGLYADFRAGDYTPAGSATIKQMLPNPDSTDATYDAGEYQIYYPELAPGDGKNEVEINCELCHSPRYITMQPALPAQAWRDEVNKMRKDYGASILEETAEKIIQYLEAHYTPETRKR